jgi:hypothetical protein
MLPLCSARRSTLCQLGLLLLAPGAVACASTSPVAGVCVASRAGLSVDLAPESKAVCETIEAQSSSVDTTVLSGRRAARREMTEALHTLARSPVRVFYFSGHGALTQAKDDVEFALQGESPGNIEWIPFSRALDELTTTRAGKVQEGWSVVLLNTCNSGYASVALIPRPVTVIGSGYGAVDIDTKQASVMSPFARALTKALEGYADIGPHGNCDGVVTDREAADYTNYLLKSTITRSTAPDLWKKRPSAVLRRQWTGELPITWHHLGRSCQRVDPRGLLAKPWASLLPEPFRKALAALARWQTPPTPGQPPPPLASVNHVHLFVDGSVDVPPDARELLVKRGERLGATVVCATIAAPDLRDLARAAFFTDVLELTKQPGYMSSDSILKLVRLRDGAVLWTDIGIATRPLSAESVLRALPARFELFDSGLEPSRTAVRDRPLYVQANVPVLANTELVLSRWGEFLAGQPGHEKIAVARPLAAVPCLGGYGQCFSVIDPACKEGKPCERREPWEWVVVDRD